MARQSICISVIAEVVRIECSQQIVVALRRIAVPQRAQLRDRRVVPVDAQVNQRETFALHHHQMRAAHGAMLTAGGEALLPMLAAVAQPDARRDPPGMRAASPEAPARVARMLPIAQTSCAGASLISGLVRAPLRPRCCPPYPAPQAAATAPPAWTRPAHPASAAPNSRTAAMRARVAQAADRCDAASARRRRLPHNGRTRAPTAIEEVATAAPIWPVRGQRPMREKVIVSDVALC